MTIIGFLTSVPLMLYKEGAMMGEFFDLFMNNKEVFNNTVLSGLTFCEDYYHYLISWLL